jgi:type II secretory pathway pseudopilin PulG
MTRTSLRRLHDARGFTILELIVIVAIVGLTMGIVAPRFRLSGTTAVQLAGTQLAQDIDVTRTRALTTRQKSRVSFESASKGYGGYLDHDDDGTISEIAVEWQNLRGFGERPLPPGISYGRGGAPNLPDDDSNGSITFADSRVEFDSRGLTMPQGSGGVVYLQSDTEPGAAVAVQVLPSGNVRLWTWKAGEGWK